MSYWTQDLIIVSHCDYITLLLLLGFFARVNYDVPDIYSTK